MFKGVVLHIINFKIRANSDEKVYIDYDPNLDVSLRMMLFLFQINHKQRSCKVPYDIFHLPELIEVTHLEHDYIIWLMDRNVRNLFSLDLIYKPTIYFLLLFSQTNSIFVIIHLYLMQRQKHCFYKPIKLYKCKVPFQ